MKSRGVAEGSISTMPFRIKHKIAIAAVVIGALVLGWNYYDLLWWTPVV